jgi:hypothetical protein
MFSLCLYSAIDGSGKTTIEECGLLGCTAMWFGESLVLLVCYSNREDERYVPPKRRAVSELRGVRTQKSVLFIVPSVKASNQTRVELSRKTYTYFGF